MRGRGVGPVWISYSDFWCILAVLFLLMVQDKRPTTAGLTQAADYIITISWDVQRADADIDLWVVAPDGKPVFFHNRQNGCIALDQDNRGWKDSIVHNADGSVASVKQAKETVAIRCRQTGHYDVGVNFYVYNTHPDRPDTIEESDHMGIKAHVEVTRINPTVTTMFDKTVVLNESGQTVNAVSFDVLSNGDMKETDVPLTPVTKTRSKVE